MHSGGGVYRGRLAGHDNGIASWQSGVEPLSVSGGPLRLGATLAGNLNLEQPFAAFILSVQLGRVPDR